MSDNHHEEAHTGPIKNPKQLLVAVLFSFVIPIFAIIGLVLYVTSADKPAAGAVNPEKAIAERIQKIGMVEVRDANRPLKSGEEVFKAQCSACHASGAAGAPKFGDAAAWAARIGTGFEALVQSALKGKGAMAPKVAATSTTPKLRALWPIWPMRVGPSLPNLLLPQPLPQPLRQTQRQPPLLHQHPQQPLQLLRPL